MFHIPSILMWVLEAHISETYGVKRIWIVNSEWGSLKYSYRYTRKIQGYLTLWILPHSSTKGSKVWVLLVFIVCKRLKQKLTARPQKMLGKREAIVSFWCHCFWEYLPGFQPGIFQGFTVGCILLLDYPPPFLLATNRHFESSIDDLRQRSTKFKIPFVISTHKHSPAISPNNNL